MRLEPSREEKLAYWLTPYEKPPVLNIKDFHRHTATLSQQIQVTTNMVIELASGLKLFLTMNRTNDIEAGFARPMNGHFSAQVLTFKCSTGLHQMQDCEPCRTNRVTKIMTLKGEVVEDELSLDEESFANFLEGVYSELTEHELLSIDTLDGIVMGVEESEALYAVFSATAKDSLREVKGIVYWAEAFPSKLSLKARMSKFFIRA